MLFENSGQALGGELYQPYWEPTKAPTETSEDVEISTWQPLGNKTPTKSKETPHS